MTREVAAGPILPEFGGGTFMGPAMTTSTLPPTASHQAGPQRRSSAETLAPPRSNSAGASMLTACPAPGSTTSSEPGDRSMQRPGYRAWCPLVTLAVDQQDRHCDQGQHLPQVGGGDGQDQATRRLGRTSRRIAIDASTSSAGALTPCTVARNGGPHSSTGRSNVSSTIRVRGSTSSGGSEPAHPA